MQFLVCVSCESFGELSTDDLTVGGLYEVISSADKGLVRVIDDPGEAFLYPASLFSAAAEAPSE